ncbi:type VI secretion protein [Pseudomonas stutzeri]|nr:type VI secretion protein [Stutzerimonas stutzeri]MCQ4326863.1 type VI secretion protein [Stutzerimonas stutzeri]
MKTISGSTALLVLALALAGCTGNYKFSDDQYRPLGDPQALNRGK